jgi:HD-like signal output (HDOD) protein
MVERLNERIEEYIRNMPSLPTTVAKVLEVCNNPQTRPADLNQIGRASCRERVFTLV